MEEELVNISANYPLDIYKAYDNDERSTAAVQDIVHALVDIYRYFEPSFFTGHFYVIKHFEDKLVLNRQRGILIQYDKNILFNKTSGVLILQIFKDGKLILWENEQLKPESTDPEFLVYHFHINREYFIANKKIIEITDSLLGSRFATQYVDLMKALNNYATSKIFHSSCAHFANSWFDKNRIFFKGGGSGSNIPEMYMQRSLHEYLRTYLLRGISIEGLREYNVGEDNPKPVDVKIHWKEANRVALIEIKFMGIVKGNNKKITSRHGSPRANKGITQLKEYYDKALVDTPTNITKAYLVVIDGRRNNVDVNTKKINYADGTFFKDKDIEIDHDKKFHESIAGIEKPLRMFAAPICS